jgi:glycosyltransferase involved in cell wall biosynthesis
VGKEPIRKGLAETVEAFLHVARVKRDVELIVVSRDVPSYLVEVMSKCSHIRLYNRFVPQEEFNRLMVESDVIVLPTHAETLGAVLIEGMARGCATLTCDYEPLNEVAPDGIVGFTVPRGDVQALAEKMLILSTERDLLAQMQKNAWRHYLEIYSRESVVPKLILAYQEAIQRYATRCS